MSRTIRACGPRCFSIGLIAAVVVLSLPGWSSAKSEAPQEVSSTEWFVTLGISAPGTNQGTVVVRDHGLAIYANDDLDLSIGIVPHIRDTELGLVDLEVFEAEVLFGTETVITRGALIDTTDAVRDTESFVAVNGLPVEIVVLEIGHDPYSSLGFSPRQCQRTPPNQHLMPRETCCVSCNGQTYCGCSTSTSCGSCCGCGLC